MPIDAIDLADQQHGAAEVAPAHLFQPCLLHCFRVSGLFKGREDLVLRCGEAIDKEIYIGGRFGDE